MWGTMRLTWAFQEDVEAHVGIENSLQLCTGYEAILHNVLHGDHQLLWSDHLLQCLCRHSELPWLDWRMRHAVRIIHP